jgi:DNA polymerase III delta prime subunit
MQNHNIRTSQYMIKALLVLAMLIHASCSADPKITMHINYGYRGQTPEQQEIDISTVATAMQLIPLDNRNIMVEFMRAENIDPEIKIYLLAIDGAANVLNSLMTTTPWNTPVNFEINATSGTFLFSCTFTNSEVIINAPTSNTETIAQAVEQVTTSETEPIAHDIEQATTSETEIVAESVELTATSAIEMLAEAAEQDPAIETETIAQAVEQAPTSETETITHAVEQDPANTTESISDNVEINTQEQDEHLPEAS